MASIGFKNIGEHAHKAVAQMKPTTPVWISSKPRKNYPQLTESGKTYDVAVIGGGIVGVTTAFLLKEAGKKVALLEALKIGCGTTGSSTAKLSAQQHLVYSTIKSKHGAEAAKTYGEMQMSAIGEAQRLVEKFQIKCGWSRSPSYTWTSTQSQLKTVKEEYELMKSFNWPAEYIDGNTKGLPESIGCLGAAKLNDQVEFNPYLFCEALAAEIDGAGSVVHENSRVIDVSVGVLSSKKDHAVKLDGGVEIRAEQVILATHMPILDQSGHFGILSPSRSHCVLFKLSKPMLDGMYISAEEPLKSLRIVGDGTCLLVSGQSLPQGKDTNTNKHYAEIEEWTRKHFPVQEVTGKWSAMDYYSGDHVPYIGLLHRGTDSVYTATGFSKWGLTNGIAAAMIIRDSIQKSHNPYADLVDARRWDLTKTLGTILEENVSVTKHLIGDKLKTLIAPDIKSLKPGEGGLVKAGGEGTVGAYIDEQGKCHAVNAVCSHLGCNLNFNQGDICWDCPCHGSRFDVDGNVLHGPAVYALKKANIEW